MAINYISINNFLNSGKLKNSGVVGTQMTKWGLRKISTKKYTIYSH